MFLFETQGLIKSYGSKRVVNNVSIYVKKGEVVGLLGPNGAGKTTTFHMIVGLIKPQSGKIVFHGKDVARDPMYQRARNGMGYLSQESSIFGKLTVEQNMFLVLEQMGKSTREIKSKTEKLLLDFRILHLAKNRANTLSGGERRRLEICRVLTTNPSFILLDEPFSGVDPIAVSDIQQIILDLKKKGISVLLTDHNVRETLAITDRSYIIYQGEVLVSGDAYQLTNHEHARRYYLGEKFVLSH